MKTRRLNYEHLSADLRMQNGEDFDLVPPYAASLIESLRSYGYSINTAIADLIDNSIAANAKSIWINFLWKGRNTSISIVDDGDGMSEDSLRDAMRLGSRDPRDRREIRDLGRFGLGLKTASFSQGRSLSVASKVHSGCISFRRWDLDYISNEKDWKLLKTGSENSVELARALDELPSGTFVLLEKLDRIVGDADEADEVARKHFYSLIEGLENHLAMVFHRFLEPPVELKIFVNGHGEFGRIKPWNPFLVSNPATHTLPTEAKQLPDGEVRISGYVLPHKDKLGPEQHRSASGPQGWNEQQGFYVYRNKRLLVPGSWLGLGGRSQGWTKEEHYKLARIKVDLPSSLDADWGIDVKKSVAVPPISLRRWLEKYADNVRSKARQVFAHRGAYHQQPAKAEQIQIWRHAKRAGNRVYRIDRKHPLVSSIKLDITEVISSKIESLLKLIEECVPVERIWLNMAERPEESSEPFGGMTEQEILTLAEAVANACSGRQSIPDTTVIQMVCNLEGFSKYEDLIRAHFAAKEQL